MTTHDDDRVALVTGGTAGLGLALTRALAHDGWRVVTDGRSGDRVAAVAGPRVIALSGDVTDPRHRAELAAAVEGLGRLDLLVHNASTLGPLPMRELADAPDLDVAWRTNVAAPHALTVALLPWLRAADGILVSISSDAAVEHYETWGPYGATKAALDHLTVTFGAETGLAAYAVDPGDMRTAMHQDAFPGEDIGDRPLPEAVVPHLLALIEQRPPSGRLRAREVVA